MIMMVFGIASFVLGLLLTSAALQDLNGATQKYAYIGQEVNLNCTRKVKSNVGEIFWFKNGEVFFRVGFKEHQNCYLEIHPSFAKLVILSVEENDSGLYQCGSEQHVTNLTVLKISQPTSESSDYKHVDLLQNILHSIYVNRTIIITVLITLVIGFGIIVAFYLWMWQKGKSKQRQTNAGDQEVEGPLTNGLDRLVDDMRNAQEISLDMIEKLKDNMDSIEALKDRLTEEMRAMRETPTVTSWEDRVSEISKLQETVSEYHSIIVNELKQQRKINRDQEKTLRNIQEILQHSRPLDGHSIPVIDAGR